MRLPNFLIIGAAKSGTSSLYQYLLQHPQIFMCFPKEPTFFGHEGESGLFRGPGDNDEFYRSRMITSLDQYTALFQGVKDEQAIGDASIFHLYLPKASATIRKYIPDVTMFAVLRNPADRAYSNYLHLRRQLREPYDFARALREEPARIARSWNEIWHYRNLGYYHQQLKRYFGLFNRHQIHIYLYEDLQQDPRSVVNNIFETLGVDASFVPETTKKYNVGYLPRNQVAGKLAQAGARALKYCSKAVPRTHQWRVRRGLKMIDNAMNWNRIAPPAMPVEIRASLLAGYREDILRLQDLIGRDLSHWLMPVPQPEAALA